MAVVVVGTLDTKAEEIGFARDVLEAQGVDVHVVDTGVMGDPGFEPDTSAAEVAAAADADLDHLREDADRGEAMEAMGAGAAAVAARAVVRARARAIRPRARPRMANRKASPKRQRLTRPGTNPRTRPTPLPKATSPRKR